MAIKIKDYAIVGAIPPVLRPGSISRIFWFVIHSCAVISVLFGILLRHYNPVALDLFRAMRPLAEFLQGQFYTAEYISSMTSLGLARYVQGAGLAMVLGTVLLPVTLFLSLILEHRKSVNDYVLAIENISSQRWSKILFTWVILFLLSSFGFWYSGAELLDSDMRNILRGVPVKYYIVLLAPVYGSSLAAIFFSYTALFSEAVVRYVCRRIRRTIDA
ncbi:MAG TPA: hypothetical protein VEH84_09320 [Alphaproteobacteria bacterium]|nr:hypothetical protein [Alphaproteobacteria bacterium]